MNANIKAMPAGIKKVISVSVIIAIAIGCIFLFAIKREQPDIYGLYRIHSEDPSVKLYIAGQNTYIKVGQDRTIIYNTTINGIPKFHFDGTFTQQNDEIIIQWKSGKLPANLKIEQQGNDQVIQIGTTLYKKERTGR